MFFPNVHPEESNTKTHTSTNNLQCHLRPSINLAVSVPSANNPSRSICSRNTTPPSSSPPLRCCCCCCDCPAISTATSTHESSPLTSPWPPSVFASCVFHTCAAPPRTVRSTSARTPTTASVPSAKQMRALPLAAGSRSVSARSGRNEVGARASGRMGGVSERELCR